MNLHEAMVEMALTIHADTSVRKLAVPYVLERTKVEGDRVVAVDAQGGIRYSNVTGTDIDVFALVQELKAEAELAPMFSPVPVVQEPPKPTGLSRIADALAKPRPKRSQGRAITTGNTMRDKIARGLAARGW